MDLWKKSKGRGRIMNAKFRTKDVFLSSLFRVSFSDLFHRSSDSTSASEEGIMAAIHSRGIVPAKGGSRKPLNEWSDMTYFTHVLNAMVISGRFLESYLLDTGLLNTTEMDSEQEGYVRLFFAAVSMHDADKLFGEGYEGALDLHGVLERNKQEIVKLCSYYLRSRGDFTSWWNDLVYLILGTEDRTADSANVLGTDSSRRDLASLIKYMKLADQLGGSRGKDINSIYAEIKKAFSGGPLGDLKNQLNLLTFSNLPQTLLVEDVQKAVIMFLTNNGRRIIVEFPDGLIYFGKKANFEEFKQLAANFRFSDMSPESIIRKYAPSSNSIKRDWASDLSPTEENVKHYVETYPSQVLLWKDRIKEKSSFALEIGRTGVPLHYRNDKGKERLLFDPPGASEEEELDEDISRRRYLGLIASASRVLYDLDDDIMDSDIDKNSKEVYEKHVAGTDKILEKTGAALITATRFAGESLDEIRKEYKDRILKISELMKAKYKLGNSTTGDEETFFLSALGLHLDIQEVPDKKHRCVQCGSYSTNLLKDHHTFGYKATDGTGLKPTVITYGDAFNGRICDLCKLENYKRASRMTKTSKKVLSMQINLADYMAPVDVPDFAAVIIDDLPAKHGDFNLSNIGGPGDEHTIVRIGKNPDQRLGLYTLYFSEKPGKMAEEFHFLLDLLRFVRSTGLKVNISELFAGKVVFTPMFQWESSPDWVRRLDLDKVRIDRLESALHLLDLIARVARISGDYRSSLPFTLRNAARSKRGIFYAISRAMSRLEKSKARTILREIEKEMKEYMEKNRKETNMDGMMKVVEGACEIFPDWNKYGPTSNNDNSWMIREALDVYSRYVKDDDESVKQKIAGVIWDIAKRRQGLNSQNLISGLSDASMSFADSLVDMLREENGAKLLNSYYRKDVTAQFSFLYNRTKWKRIESKGGSK